jgi:6,7-dimethyl-8-ribityllumazine synthase
LPKTIEGELTARTLRAALVVSRYNELIGRKLLDGAIDCLVRHDADDKNLDVIWVPGAFEIPLIARKAAGSGRYDVVVCLGAVIRGETPHFDFVASESAKGIAQAGMETGVPIIFGIVTTDTVEQAIKRAGTTVGNRGFDAALAGIEMANLVKKLGA